MRESAQKTIALLAVCSLFAVGCVGIDPEARKVLKQPANCGAASQQIPMLEEEHASWVWRITQGVQGIAPPMVVISLVRDLFAWPYRSVYLDHWRVAFGSYNGKIDDRVGELKKCP
jgi:hypothetical protein